MHLQLAVIAATVLAAARVHTPLPITVTRSAGAATAGPRAEPNNQRRPAGQLVNGERRIALDIVPITWLVFDHVAAPRDGVMIVSGELSGIGVGDIPAGGAV